MASYNPPTETLPIFDPSVFIQNDIPLTAEIADLRYLKFPYAQGTENLQTTNVNGVLTINNQNLIITDGTTTNTMNKTGYTTKNTVQTTIHYPNMSDSSATGVGAIQKSENLSFYPGAVGAGRLGINTGIGVTPARTLDVVGSVRITNAALNQGTLYLGDNTGAAAFMTLGANVLGTLEIVNQVSGSTSIIKLGTNNSSGTGLQIDNTGLITTSAGITSTGLITANNGLTLGSNKVITLGSGATAPGVGQLGYIYSGSPPGIVGLGTGNNQVLSSILSVPAGTYMIFGTATYTANAAIITSVRGYIQASGAGIIGDSITWGRSTTISTDGCINVSTCFTSTSASSTYELGMNISFSGTSVSTSNTNFVFKLVKIG